MGRPRRRGAGVVRALAVLVVTASAAGCGGPSPQDLSNDELQRCALTSDDCSIVLEERRMCGEAPTRDGIPPSPNDCETFRVTFAESLRRAKG